MGLIKLDKFKYPKYDLFYLILHTIQYNAYCIWTMLITNIYKYFIYIANDVGGSTFRPTGKQGVVDNRDVVAF